MSLMDVIISGLFVGVIIGTGYIVVTQINNADNRRILLKNTCHPYRPITSTFIDGQKYAICADESFRPISKE